MNYWWINANTEKHKEHWNWITSQKVGETEEWNLKGETGRSKGNFRNVEKGDLVIGYSSGKQQQQQQQQQLVALATITDTLHENIDRLKVIDIKKLKNIKPVDYSFLKEFSSVSSFCDKGALLGTVIRISEDEYYELIRKSKIK